MIVSPTFQGCRLKYQARVLSSLHLLLIHPFQLWARLICARSKAERSATGRGSTRLIQLRGTKWRAVRSRRLRC